LYSEYLANKALEGFGDFRIEGQVICTEKYAEVLVLLAMEEAVLQGMIDRLIETGRRYGLEMNVKESKVMRISRQPSLIQIRVDQKQPANMEYFSCLGSIVTSDERCTCEIKSGIVMAKAAFNKKKTLFTSKSDFNLRKKLMKC
jgi:hypothetical protein